MSETTVRGPVNEPTGEKPLMAWEVDQPDASGQHTSGSLGDSEPTTDISSAILKALNVDSPVSDMPEIDKGNLNEISSYLGELLQEKGVVPTERSIARILNDMKLDMEIDFEAEPEVVIDKIAGLVKSWKGIVFIKDPKERRSLFMKLARQPDSKSMDRMIWDEMDRRKVYNGQN
jgi:hypothetical protein